jgi:hypothetical protein
MSHLAAQRAGSEVQAGCPVTVSSVARRRCCVAVRGVQAVQRGDGGAALRALADAYESEFPVTRVATESRQPLRR